VLALCVAIAWSPFVEWASPGHSCL